MIRGAVILLISITVLYGLYLAYPLLSGPSLTLSSPTEAITTPDGLVVIAGTAKRSTSLIINGGPVYMDTSGNFSMSFVLPPGSAILEVTARDRMGRSRTIQKTVYVPLPPNVEQDAEETSEEEQTDRE